MILSNIITSLGLVNGANRIIRDFIYTDGDKAPQLPYAIIIECNDNKGPPFYSGIGQEKRVPIRAVTAKWGENNKFSREQFPIALSLG